MKGAASSVGRSAHYSMLFFFIKPFTNAFGSVSLHGFLIQSGYQSRLATMVNVHFIYNTATKQHQWHASIQAGYQQLFRWNWQEESSNDFPCVAVLPGDRVPRDECCVEVKIGIERKEILE